jgi:hypothetical protein
VVLSNVRCSSGLDCGGGAVNGLSITVRDGKTGGLICDATVTASDGTYSEQLTSAGSPPCDYEGALERPGTYGIEVSKVGYSATSVDGVTVPRGPCNVVRQYVAVTLQPM